jgi:plasmid stability protein
LVPFWRYIGAMPVNLSIKNAPEHVVERLRRRAAMNHRSLQGELMAIIEAAAMKEQTLSPMELVQEVRKLGLSSPSESAAMIREDRDGR